MAVSREIMKDGTAARSPIMTVVYETESVRGWEGMKLAYMPAVMDGSGTFFWHFIWVVGQEEQPGSSTS